MIARALASGQALPQDRPSTPGLVTANGDSYTDQQELGRGDNDDDYQDSPDSGPALTQMSVPGYASTRASTDSGASSQLDRFSARRLARLNTEQHYREQRQGSSLSAASSSPNAIDLQNVVHAPMVSLPSIQYSICGTAELSVSDTAPAVPARALFRKQSSDLTQSKSQ